MDLGVCLVSGPCLHLLPAMVVVTQFGNLDLHEVKMRCLWKGPCSPSGNFRGIMSPMTEADAKNLRTSTKANEMAEDQYHFIRAEVSSFDRHLDPRSTALHIRGREGWISPPVELAGAHDS
jgi:hypothetical protein